MTTLTFNYKPGRNLEMNDHRVVTTLTRRVSTSFLKITEARIAAEPLSCSCCEAKSEGFERGSVREIGLLNL